MNDPKQAEIQAALLAWLEERNIKLALMVRTPMGELIRIENFVALPFRVELVLTESETNGNT